MYKKHLILTVVIILFSTANADAGNFGFGVHSGYGIIKFKEKEAFLGDNIESESKQDVILFGVSGEYSFQGHENFYAGITTDWASGLGDREIWRQDNVQVQTNDMKVFGQFYDVRAGYKNSFDNLYYRLYVSGGWDGLYLKRNDVIWQETPKSDSTEDISLWRIGLGTGLGYKLKKWALDGRLAYSYYPKGRTEDSSLPQFTFDTNGTCLDIGLGVAREIRQNMNFYLGASYTLQELKGDASNQNISWESQLEIIVGVVNLTYTF